MNISKLVSAASLALALAGVASATPIIVNVTGSTAFRTATTAAEITTLSFASGGGATNPVAAFIGSANGFEAATYSIIEGYLSDGVTQVIFRNDWTGATAGVTDLANGNVNLTWIPVASLGSTTINSAGTGGTALSSGANTDTAAPQISMDDENYNDSAASIVTAQSPGSTYASHITGAAIQAGGTSGGANGGPVAACTFQWTLGALASGTGSQPFTNVTQEQAAALLKQGYLSLAAFTGNSSDANNFVLYVGRNEDSGTRCAYDAESLGGGIFGSSAFGASINQYMIKQSGAAYPTTPNYSGLSVGSNTVAGFQLWPKKTTDGSNVGWFVNTIPSLTWNSKGHSGYNTGGDIDTILETPNPVSTTGWTVSDAPANGGTFTLGTSTIYIITCVGASDSHKIQLVTPSGGTAGIGLNYCGSAYNEANVDYGVYPLWTTEYLYYLTSATGTQVAIGSAQAAADALADAIYNTPTSGLANAGVKYSSIVARKSALPAGSYPY